VECCFGDGGGGGGVECEGLFRGDSWGECLGGAGVRKESEEQSSISLHALKR